MASSRALLGGYAAPTAALAATLIGLASLARYPGFYADKALLALLAGFFLWLVWHRTRRTNMLIARFVVSLTSGDLTQSFGSRGRGAGLDELGDALDAAVGRLRAERHAGAAESRFAAALVDEAPMPLLAVSPEGQVKLANKAARRLFREADGREASAFRRYGAAFADALVDLPPGARRTCPVRWDGLAQRAIVSAALAERQGAAWRIVSVQIIQNELAAAEMATQTDLVRVLTHEIMNSLTPVTSLAQSASRTLDATDGRDAAALDEARLAVRTLARRAEAITGFVRSYRTFSEKPTVSIVRFDAVPWLHELVRSFRATPEAAGVTLEARLPDHAFELDGDANLLGQVVLNLLRNGAQASATSTAPRVALVLSRDDAGRPVLTVRDNGPGVPTALRDEIFLPFFTTKPGGSGIGLSFARQVILLHGGMIGVSASDLSGATFKVVL